MCHCRCPHKFIADMNGTGYMDGIQSASFQICSDRSTVMHIKTARYFITAVDSCKNCDLSFCHLLYFFDDQTGETHSVLKRTTKFVQSLVRSRRKESAYQIAVCHMDLNCIYACFHSSLCCEAIAFYQFIYFFSRNFLWCISSTV